MNTNIYIESMLLGKKIHHLFLENIKSFLYHFSYKKINANQALMIYHIGAHIIKSSNTIIKNLHFHDYPSSSYNINSLIKEGYLISRVNEDDRRIFLFSLSDKGQLLYDSLKKFLHNQKDILSEKGITKKELRIFLHYARTLEKLFDFDLSYHKAAPVSVSQDCLCTDFLGIWKPYAISSINKIYNE